MKFKNFFIAIFAVFVFALFGTTPLKVGAVPGVNNNRGNGGGNNNTKDFSQYYVVVETSADFERFSAYLQGGDSDVGIDLKIPDSDEYLFKAGSVTNSFYFNTDAFEASTKTNQKAVIGKLYDIFNNDRYKASQMEPKSRQVLTDALQSQSQTAANLWSAVALNKQGADIGTGVQKLSSVLPTYRWILGLLTILVIMVVAFTTIIDMAAVNVPIANEFFTKKFGKDGGKPSIITNTAWKAIKVSQQAGDGDGSGGFNKTGTFVYFKDRAIELVIFIISVVYLAMGNLGDLIVAVMDVFSGK